MPITLCTPETWAGLATKTLPLQLRPHVFRGLHGKSWEIRPHLAEYAHVQILGGDWLPVTGPGYACYEGMVHTPGLFPRKSRALAATSEGYIARPTIERQSQGPLILVGGSANYYHWLIDNMPRLLMAESFPEYDHWPIVMNADPAPFQQASLRLLGIEPTRVLHLQATESIRAPRVLIPALLSHTTLCHPEVPRMLRAAFPARTPSNADRKRILISRADATNRRLTNESALRESLAPWGFECYRLSELDFQAQIDLFAQADIVVGVHGAGLANLVFCPPGTTVVDIAHVEHKVSSMKVLAMLNQLPHHFVPARTTLPERHPNPLLNDWNADIAAVRQVLQTTHPLTPGG